jgi:hypothetical protein
MAFLNMLAIMLSFFSGVVLQEYLLIRRTGDKSAFLGLVIFSFFILVPLSIIEDRKS